MADPRRLSYHVRNAVFGALIGLTIPLSCLLIAVADPGGWAAWRVGLCAMPAVFIGAAMGGTFPE